MDPVPRCINKFCDNRPLYNTYDAPYRYLCNSCNYYVEIPFEDRVCRVCRFKDCDSPYREVSGCDYVYIDKAVTPEYIQSLDIITLRDRLPDCVITREGYKSFGNCHDYDGYIKVPINNSDRSTYKSSKKDMEAIKDKLILYSRQEKLDHFPKVPPVKIGVFNGVDTLHFGVDLTGTMDL